MRDVAATKISAGWMNGVQAELHAVLVTEGYCAPRLPHRMRFRLAKILKKLCIRAMHRPMKKGVS